MPHNYKKEENVKFIIRFAAALLLAAGGIAQAQNLSIATGGTGGVYYPLGGGFAAVLSKKVPGMQATAEVTGGSVANMQLIGTGKPYIAFTQADAAIDALKGQDKFAGKREQRSNGNADDGIHIPSCWDFLVMIIWTSLRDSRAPLTGVPANRS